MKQNRLNSWASRLRKISALCLMLVASTNLWADNKLTIKPDVKAGQTGTITIALDNATDYTAFQMDIKLPVGLSIESTGAMEIVSAVNADHNVAYNTVDGVTKVAAYSFDGASSGNNAFKASGDLLIITVTAAADYAPADVEVSGIIFVTQSDLAAVTDFVVETEAGLMGDVNNNGRIDIADAVCVINKVVAKSNAVFIENRADMNGNGRVDIGDAVSIVNIVVGKTPVETSRGVMFLPDPQ